ncbi:hypothetical protein JF55_11530 [Pseudomonas sp. 1-7]|nr:hypothetical protein JF55_11530 [Pseudomonas sp. 1-7]
MWNHMGQWANDWGWGWMAFGALHMLLFWALVIGGIVLLVRLLAGGNDGDGSRDREDPLAILKARYARGEIDKAEYERIREELRH